MYLNILETHFNVFNILETYLNVFKHIKDIFKRI
jgi:hypothetical protein